MNVDELFSEIDDQLEVLGLTRPTTKDEIREAWRKKTRVTHPDQQGNTPEAHEAMKELNLAYEFLMRRPDPFLSSERAVRGRQGRERAERQRRQREQAERQKQQRERAERQKQQQERAERQRRQREQAERETQERERRERDEYERLAREWEERQRQQREQEERQSQEEVREEHRERILVRLATAAGLIVLAGASYVLYPLL